MSRSPDYGELQKFLDEYARRDLLRFCTLGSVDDGKSSLIGRLLHDTGSIYEDQLAALRRDTARLGTAGEIDFALVTDGLRAEREQGITIDVAYRYFSTSKRAFIIADVPGHEQYTRNMATGASTAHLALILVDAQQGVVTQTKRHAFIASLLGIPRVLVAVNKMDLVAYGQGVFDTIVEEFGSIAARMGFIDLRFVPVCALDGGNIVKRSLQTPWYAGESVLEILEGIYVGGDENLVDLRLPIQSVIRSPDGRRALGGQIAAGLVRTGDEVLVLPSRSRSRIRGILAPVGEVEVAFAPMSVAVTLQDDLDISRGHCLVHPRNLPQALSRFEAMVVWMSEEPLGLGRSYLVKHTTRTMRASVERLEYRVDVNTLSRAPAATLRMNEIGRAAFHSSEPLLLDPYRKIRATGSLILVDPETGATVGAGMVIDRLPEAESNVSARVTGLLASQHIHRERSAVPREARERRLGQRGLTVWLTGLSGSGKSSIAREVEHVLNERGHHVCVLDGDTLRFGLNRDLGFSPPDRAENVRRAAEAARLLNEAGLIVLVALISPMRADREHAREIVGADRFLEVYVNTPLEICERRDVKGLYPKARAGEIPEFTGVSAPYEPPEHPFLELRAGAHSLADCVAELTTRVEGASRLQP
jgi:bifunctional enzyme CysN/CysC